MRQPNQGAQRRRQAGRGQMMVVFALTLTVSIGAMMLGIDLSRLRAEAENAQRVANAAALAGVVFLPDFTANAAYRARQEASKNGLTDGKSGVSISASPDSTYPNRLRVTVTEPVSLVFGGVLGLGPRTVSRTAIAEYNLPLQMGSPDNVLGYAPFPTQLVSSGGTQGYYLEVRGPYGNEENGDAYSQYYKTFNTNNLTNCTDCTHQYGSGFNPQSSGEYSNPCNDPNPYGCTVSPGPINAGTGHQQAVLYPNPDRVKLSLATNSSDIGYDYVIEDPFTNTMVVKLFDPYDEGKFNADVSGSSGIASGVAPSSKSVPGFGSQYMDAYDSNAFGNHTTTTRFSIWGPGQTPNDPTMKSIGPPAGDTTCATADCALANNLTPGNYSWDAGDDPTYTTPHTGSWGTATCSTLSNSGSPSPRAMCYAANPSKYAYRFLNYAVIHGPGYFRIHVSAQRNSDGTFGTHGNMFGIGVCSDTDPSTGTPVQMGTASDPSANGAGTNTDPTAGATVSWNPNACKSPNAGTGCANPGTAAPGQCVHIFGLGRMCLFNNLGNGLSLIPLGYVPAQYGGKTLQVRLYDVGDSNDGHIEVLTPAGDTGHYGTNYLGSLSTLSTNAGFPAALDATYDVKPTEADSGYATIGSSTLSAGTSLHVSSATGRFNGAWLNMQIPIPANSGSTTDYTHMVSTFGGYWKMLYQVNGGNDTTTWEISVNGSPVHLVTQ